MRRDSVVPSGGLGSAEARRRLDTYGPNRPPTPPPRRLHTRILAQVRDPMILLLVAAGALTASLQDVADSVIIAAVVVFNTIIGIVQEVRADRAIAALRALSTPSVEVVRDGAPRQVPSEEVVPGDHIVLAAGDVVPADGVVVVARLLQVDQSAMTGESLPVHLAEGEAITGGTLVTAGRVEILVTRTGPDSGLGRLAGMLAATPTRATPLQRRLTELSRMLVLAVGTLTAVVVVIGLWQGRPVTEMAVVGVSLAVAAVPESLPAVVAVALALGAHRMARRNAVVRRLPAVETLGSVTVVATDKTGTVTEGRMVAERVWTPGAAYVVEGRGYEPQGSVQQDEEGAGPAYQTSLLDRLARDVMLCNDARLVHDTTGWSAIGDPLEAALLTLARKVLPVTGSTDGEWPADLWVRVAEEPFDPVSRRMTTTHRGPEDAVLTVCKGAPETVLALMPPSPDVRRARQVADRLAKEGYRVIAVADRQTLMDTSDARGLELVGLVAIDDPPRPRARDVVSACRRAGIRLLLVTGDHPGTAAAIARRVGIVPEGEMTDPEGQLVFSRVRPEEKVAIVEALQRQGEVVAMLGDGVNDAPALRRADIGVAAGLGGTEVARQAADLVLMDDDLATVVSAVEEGRRIFGNIRSFLLYAVSGGLAEVGVMLVGPALGLVIPLLPAQILWINLLTHGLTGVAFGGEPADPADMARPPRSPTESVFTRSFTSNIVLAAVSLTVASLTAGLLAGGGAGHERTSVFLALGLGQLGVAWAIRSRARRGDRQHTPGVGSAVAVAALVMVAATLAAPLQELLRTHALEPRDLLVAGLAALAPGLVMGWRVGAERASLLAGRADDSAGQRPSPPQRLPSRVDRHHRDRG